MQRQGDPVRRFVETDPGLLVSVLHVTGPTVRVGSRVVAGETPLAQHATQFPFDSQIEWLTGSAPHVHIEVRRRPEP